MRLAELLLKKKIIDQKVTELEVFLVKAVQIDAVSQQELSRLRRELDGYLDEGRTLSMQIDSANGQIEVNIKDSTVTLRDAVRLLKTIKKKIGNITDIIENNNGNIDILSFISQRDQLYEEYLLLNKSMQMIEWSAELD